jgi:hypothetical protein
MQCNRCEDPIPNDTYGSYCEDCYALNAAGFRYKRYELGYERRLKENLAEMAEPQVQNDRS